MEFLLAWAAYEPREGEEEEERSSRSSSDQKSERGEELLEGDRDVANVSEQGNEEPSREEEIVPDEAGTNEVRREGLQKREWKKEMKTLESFPEEDEVSEQFD